jgi:uncharacterized membrane protein (UPF0136 family)
VNAKLRELVEEFRTVTAGRGSLIDAAIPPVIFLVANSLWGFETAAYGALLSALLLGVLRLVRGQPLKYALGGLGAATLTIVAVRVLNRAEAYFLPGVITGLLTVIACGLSVLVRRPLVAWTSHLIRRWPLDWYWHPKVRPAYSEVTVVWAIFFGLKLALQAYLLREGRTGTLAIVNVITGWPATIVLLALSYIYGLWRLRRLQGPSVEEYKAGSKPPWTGQRRGF